MKKHAIAIAFLLGLAACSDDKEPTTTTTATPTGALAVSVSAGAALQATIAKVDLSLSGTASFAQSISDMAQLATFDQLPAGSYSLVVSAYTADSSDAVTSATVDVTVAENQISGVAVALGTGSLVIQSLTVSNANPNNTTVVDLSATLSDNTLSGLSYLWSDDCKGEFTAVNTLSTTWQNTYAESCTLSLTVQLGTLSHTLSYDLSSSYAKGTVVTVAGTYCSTKAGDTVWWGYEGDAPLIGNGGPAVDAAFGQIYGLDFGPNGDLYMADRVAGRVLRYDPDTQTIHNVVGVLGGCPGCGNGNAVHPATEATFDWLADMAVDSQGNIYIVEAFNRQVRKVYANTMTVETIINTSMGWSGPSADNTLGKSAGLCRPVAVAVDSNDIVYVSDQSCEFVYRYFPTGATVDTLTTATSPGTDYVGGLFDLDFDAQGNLWGAGRGDDAVVKYTQAGVKTVVAGTGIYGDSASGLSATSTSLNQPFGLDVVGNKTFVADSFNHKIRVIGPSNTMTTIVGSGLNYVPGQMGLADRSPIQNPVDIELDADGNIYVSEKETCQVKMVVGPY